MMPQQNAYEVRSLFFRYGSAPVGTSWAVQDVNLQVKAGEIFGHRGSERIREDVVAQTSREDREAAHWEITLFGKSLESARHQEVARQVAFVPQDNQPAFLSAWRKRC